MAVRIQREGDLAVVSIDSPPVNAIGRDVRRALMEAADTLSADASVKGVVLTGSQRIFSAGADAREFDAAPEPPHLSDVVLAIDRSPKPWVAAIRGAALGGGCELALGCRMRIASPDATIGLPEVSLGVIPGAGGTQRLPRLIGLKAALDIIPRGKVLSADAALDVGLIDRVDEDPVGAASKVLHGPLDKFPSVVSERPPCRPDDAAVKATRTRAERRMRGQVAPQRAIDLVELAAGAEISAALVRERQTFLELRNSEQARALRHIFFAERAARMPDRLKHAKPVDLARAVVVGGGTMGSGIAYALERAGCAVTLVEADAGASEQAAANVKRLFDDAVKRGLLSQSDADAGFGGISFVADYGRLPEAELAIEAAYEDIDVKRHVFRQLEAALASHAVLATNTSYLNVNEIAAALRRPERVLGLHFFSPAHVMKLLEIVRADRTSDDALAAGFQVARALKKFPVVAGVCDGFIGNRILTRYREEADIILLQGALPWTIDEAMVGFGMAMGPYMVQDLSGLDIAFAQRKRKATTRDSNSRYVPIGDRMVEAGRLGKKTGAGWYRYSGNDAAAVDDFVENLICEEARRAGVLRRAITPEEIRARLVAAMINEAADVLFEGIATKASDIDLVLVHGYGFPRWRGGLMFYADSLGTRAVLDAVEAFGREDPVIWKPSPLLRELGAGNRPFAGWPWGEEPLLQGVTR
ncbi:MAG: FAD-dependent oxidoreductase [Propylenella sp.]